MPGICRLTSVALLLLAAVGCQQSPVTAQQAAPFQQQQVAMLARQQELQSRTSSLDQDNQELQARLAQATQQNKVIQDQVAALRDQLNSTTQQLAQTRETQVASEQRTQALTASLEKRSASTIVPNSSLSRNLPTINIPGVEVRQDGDVVRIELPADRLFHPGMAQLRQDAPLLLDAVTAEIQRNYPNQIIGIEGHTDSDPAPTGWASNHQLSMSRASAVFDYLVARSRLHQQQLFLVGHGSNHPVVSNASLPGKARNRRVELVVYPEQWQK
jgi:flagellar motor protein MotB